MKNICLYLNKELPAEWQQIQIPGIVDGYSSVCFLIPEDGIQVLASIVDCDLVLKVSIGLVRSLKQELTEREHIEYAYMQTGEILQKLCGGRGFCKAPDSNHPTMRHYMHYLELN